MLLGSSTTRLRSCSPPIAGEHEHRCLEDREEANRRSAESGFPLFIPVCREDGTYVEVRVVGFTDTEHVLRDVASSRRQSEEAESRNLGPILLSTPIS